MEASKNIAFRNYFLANLKRLTANEISLYIVLMKVDFVEKLEANLI